MGQKGIDAFSQADFFKGLCQGPRSALFERVKNKRVVLPEYWDPRVKEAAVLLEKYCNVVVVPFDDQYVASRRSELLSFFAEAEARKGKASDPLCFSPEKMALFLAGLCLRSGECDAVVAGASTETAWVIRAILATVGLKNDIKTLTSAFLMNLRVPAPGGQELLLYTDAGVVPSPSSEQLVDIAFLGAESYRAWTDTEPQVGFLSFSTYGSAKHPDVEKVRKACELFCSRYPELRAMGELQFDAAVVPDIALSKCKGQTFLAAPAKTFDAGHRSQESPSGLRPGGCNVLVFPDLNSGNICYKATERLAGAEAWGPLILGSARPFADLSRGCSALDIVHVALLTLSLP